MIITLNSIQTLKLSELFMDLGKGLLLTSLATPVFTSVFSYLATVKTIVGALLSIYISLRLLSTQEENI
jgi:hypothetical protein